MHFSGTAIRALAIVALLALLAGCATTSNRPTAAQQTAVERAQSLQRQGLFMAEAAAWEQLADDYDGWQDRYLLRAAEAYRQLDDWEGASAMLEDIDRQNLNRSQATHLDLLRAGAALAHKRPRAALALVTGAEQLPQQWRLRALELRARAQADAGQPLAAAHTRLVMNDALRGLDRSANQRLLLGYLESMNVAALQAAATRMSASAPLRSWVARALEAKGSALARTLPQLHSPVGELLPNAGTAVGIEGFAPPQAVALLLPASGPLGPAAAAVRDGFKTAWQQHPMRSGKMRLNEYDSLGTAAGAIHAYRQAVASGADLVVGPLAPEAVDALFQRAPLPVPLLALNHADHNLPPPGSFEFALLPETEGAQVAARMLARGLHEAAMFLADAKWAKRTARAFRAQFESQGGDVIGSATLPLTQVDYSNAITALMANAGPQTGVFIAMRPDQGRLLVPQLRIARVTQPMFATSHIYAVGRAQGLDRDLNGVVFPDAPWLFDSLSGSLKRSDLAETNRNARGPAARLLAFGMDAFALMPYLDWLSKHPGSYLPGATGKLSIDSFGHVRRTPIWATFLNGIARPVDKARAMHQARAQRVAERAARKAAQEATRQAAEQD